MSSLTISITDVCPNRCSSCFSWKSNKSMSLENFKKITMKLRNRLEDDDSTIALTGGEPFSHPDLLSMAKFCANTLEIKPVIFTSGVIHPTDLSEFEPYVSNFAVSMKYPNDRHSAWLRNPGGFSKAKEFIIKCNMELIPTAIHYAVDKMNIRYIDEMIKFADEHYSEVHLLRFLSFDTRYKMIELNDIEFDKLCDKYKDKLKIIAPSKYTCGNNCQAGVQRINVQVNSNYTPCLYLQDKCFALGNVLKEDKDIINRKLEMWREMHGQIDGCIADLHLQKMRAKG